MDIREYLNLAECNFGNEEEVVITMMSPKLAQWVEYTVLERLLFWSHPHPSPDDKVLERNFRIPQGCAQNLASIACFEEHAEALVAQRARMQGELDEMVRSISPMASIRSLEAKWIPWNEYDPLCNPELKKPSWKIYITAYYA